MTDFNLMELNVTSILLGSSSLAGSAAYVAARWTENDLAAVVAKVTASSAFVAIAIVNGAMLTPYGRLILAALLFSWLGDILLLSLRSSYLLAGIAMFFVAHVGFVAAFATQRPDPIATGVSLAAVGLLGAVVLGWLWKYLNGFYRIAVPLYLAAITLMVALAVGAAGAGSLPFTVAVGAFIFAVSDVSVARDRFVEKSIANKTWGLPLYYLAQVLLAASVSIPPN